jgi:hypothetical protein
VDTYTDISSDCKSPRRRHVRCSVCDKPSGGHFYCVKHRRIHAEATRTYMRRRWQQDQTFAAAERIKTRERMRRLRERRRLEKEARS